MAIAMELKELLQKTAKDEPSFEGRDFFWDKLVMILATAITGLAATDLGAQIFQQRGVTCYVPDEFNVSLRQYDFIQMFCSGSVPDSQYLPLFFLCQGVTIGALHYFWKSSFSHHFNYFFSLSKGLTLIRHEETGEYSYKNVTLIKMLRREFDMYGCRLVFSWYQFKLAMQIIVASLCIAGMFFFAAKNKSEFNCPENMEDSAWPFPGREVVCDYLSHRSFLLTSYVDVIFLLAILLSVIFGLLWTITKHPEVLHITDACLFAFTSGINSRHFLAKSWCHTPWCCSRCHYFFPSPFCCVCCGCCLQSYGRGRFVSWIQTDFQFFLMFLYRVDSGLAHAFRDGLIHIEYQALWELDHVILTNGDIDLDEEGGKLKYRCLGIAAGIAYNPSNRAQYLDKVKGLQAPPEKIRGYILRIAAQRSAHHRLAIDVSFGNNGFSTVLARLFEKVGSFNFDPAYKDDKATTKLVNTTIIPDSKIMRYCSKDDIFCSLTETTKFNTAIMDLWSTDETRIDFIVIGPIVEIRSVGTAKHLLETLSKRCGKGAILVIIYPVRISKRYAGMDFYHFDPTPKDRWFIIILLENARKTCGNIECNFNIRVYKYDPPNPVAPPQNIQEPLVVVQNITL